MILVSKHIVPNGYAGITVYPFVFVKAAHLKFDRILVNHEKIHLRQQLELLVFPFFIWYVIEFLVKYLQYKNWYKAYKNISFEREAYTNQKDLDYLKSRSFWSFLNYL